MKHQKILTWFLFMPLLLSILEASHVSMVTAQCQGDQQSLLLQLKQILNFSQSFSGKLASWNSSIDCCKWPGVSCDMGGFRRVIGLNLSNESITGGLDNSSPLFSLEYLQVLDLSWNDFNTTVPTAVANLTNLRHLNLSRAGFFGQIPAAFSRMRSLVSLDLSTFYFYSSPLKLENPNLAALIQNLTRLTDLRLDWVNIPYAQGNEWCQALASSLPNLQVLSMSGCGLSGPIHPSILKLQSLSVIDLGANYFSSPIPDFIADFRNLTILRLSSCELLGTFPTKIFQIPSLELLDLSDNLLLQGKFPDFPQNQYSMQTLILTNTNFSGELPSSLGNLGNLSSMLLGRCNFSGTIPKSLESLTQLNCLDFSSNNFTGQIPSLEHMTQLEYLDLSSNYLTGPIPSLGSQKNLVHLDLSFNQLAGYIPSQWGSLQKLEYVDLQNNSLNGHIPPSLFSISPLHTIQLSMNQLEGQVPEFPDAASSVLYTIDLSNNDLEGPIPRSIFEVGTLQDLVLSSNRLNGSIQLNWIHALRNLYILDLSYNNLTVDARGDNNNSISLPMFTLSTLNLAWCNLRTFPELGNQSMLSDLDLSGNNIGGVVPRWILESTTISYLNLSHNNLRGLQVPISLPNLRTLDLNHNHLQGKIPILPPSLSVSYVDYSHNLFNGTITAEIRNWFSVVFFFSLSNNHIRGAIPSSICTNSFLQVLDLSDNELTGTIPSCLVENNETLDVLNLRGNKLSGSIPDRFQDSCKLSTIDLSWNQLHGRVPPSLSNCKLLTVLDLGNNMINDAFPCLLKDKSSLQVLILRNNLFHGSIECPNISGTWQKLHIFDLAVNNFSGPIDGRSLSTSEAMLVGEGNEMRNNPKSDGPLNLTTFYHDPVNVTSKGHQMELVKVLAIFKSIDFSSNNFEGPIPEAIGKFRALHTLNLSHNAFTGQIPPVFRNLSQLESMDLSDNKLSGEIPQDLTDMTFLSVLDLSNNNLIGKIPAGRQFQTFENTSYAGNPGLCGSPLTKSCSNSSSTPAVGIRHGKPGTRIHWTALSIEFGFTFGLAVIIIPAAFWPSFRLWFWPGIDSLILRMFPRLYDKDYNNRLRQRRRRRSSKR